MICNRCGYNNRDSSQFCIKCGQRLVYLTPGGASLGNTLNNGGLLQGRYKIIKQLGKGGMGVVYLANDNRFSNRVCVVKEMLEYLINENERQKAVQRFNQEADLLATVNHPNIPQVYDRFSERNRHYLVMEFVAGMDFKNLLREYTASFNTPLPEEDIAVYLTQLCLTLKYLHNHKPPILHRDIKPSNILLTADGKAKLVDFGIAKAIQTNTLGTSIGTQGYAAPEQYKGLADARTDIYALGATMHHLLTSRDPQLEAPFDYPPVTSLNDKVSTGLSDTVEWMLQMGVDQRPQCVEQLIDHMKNIYPGIEQKVLNYPDKENDILKIVSKSIVNNTADERPINICAICGYENKESSRFCSRCGKPLGGSSHLSAGQVTTNVGSSLNNKMIVPLNSRILNGYPDNFREFIRIPAGDGSTKLNVILERYFVGGYEYIYLAEKLNSIAGCEVTVYNVVRTPQGIMQFIKPVTDLNIKNSLAKHWNEFSNS